jgi:hypothetical protein
MEQGIVIVGQCVKAHLVQRKKWIKKIHKNPIWSETSKYSCKVDEQKETKMASFYK